MASIQSLGIGSGLLTTELLENIIAAEREGTDLRLDGEEAAVDAKLSAYGSVRSALDGLKSAASALRGRTTFATFDTTSSNEGVVSASANSLASPGTYQVEVDQVARAQVLATGAYDSLDTVLGTGSIEIRFGTTAFAGDGTYEGFDLNTDRPGGTIEIDAGNRTLAGVRDAINAADLGVRANIVDDGTGFRLVVASESTGAANGLQISVTEGDEAGLSALAFDAGAQNLEQTVAARDTILSVDGITVSRPDTLVAGVVQGLTFDARSAAPGSVVTVGVERNVDASAEKVEAFVDAYNEFKGLLDELTDFDPENQEAGLLLGDSALRNTASQLSRALSSTIENPFSDELRALVDVGVRTGVNYRLEFDRAAFDRAAGDLDALSSIFTASGRSTDGQVTFIGSQPYTESGDYAVEVTRLAQQGLLRTRAVPGLGSGGVTIDGSNDEFRIAVNGTQSGTIDLTQGTYTAEALAVELQQRINGDEALRRLGRTVEVTFDAARERFEIVSGTYGSDSRVAITGLDPSLDPDTTDFGTFANAFGLRLDDGGATAGRDVQARIDGATVSGRGQVLLVPQGTLGAAPGFLTGSSTEALRGGSATVSAPENTLEVTVDGVPSGAVAIPAGTYTDMDALAGEISERINADGALQAGGAAVDVFFDARNERFEFISRSTGASSGVELTAVAAGLTSELGLEVGGGFAGSEGTRAGRSVGAAGLQFGVFGGALGDRGRIDFTRGAGDRIDALLEGLLGSDGAIGRREEALRTELADIADERARFDERIAAQEARLRSQFATNDALIAQLNSTSDFLTNQLGLLPFNDLGGE